TCLKEQPVIISHEIVHGRRRIRWPPSKGFDQRSTAAGTIRYPELVRLVVIIPSHREIHPTAHRRKIGDLVDSGARRHKFLKRCMRASTLDSVEPYRAARGRSRRKIKAAAFS